jgi:hypothetical protein
MGCGISSLGVEINFHNYIQQQEECAKSWCTGKPKWFRRKNFEQKNIILKRNQYINDAAYALKNYLPYSSFLHKSEQGVCLPV